MGIQYMCYNTFMSTEEIIIHTMRDDLAVVQPTPFRLRYRKPLPKSERMEDLRTSPSTELKTLAANTAPPKDFQPRVSAPPVPKKVKPEILVWVIGIGLFLLLLAIIAAILIP